MHTKNQFVDNDRYNMEKDRADHNQAASDTSSSNNDKNINGNREGNGDSDSSSIESSGAGQSRIMNY